MNNYIYTIKFIESESIYNEDTEEYEDRIINEENEIIEEDIIDDIEAFVKYYFLKNPNTYCIVRGDWKRFLTSPTQKDIEENLIRYIEYGGEIDWLLEIKKEIK